MEPQTLGYRALLERILPTRYLSMAVQRDVRAALATTDGARLRSVARSALDDLERQGLARRLERGRYEVLTTGARVSIEPPPQPPDTIVPVTLPVADDGAAPEHARELLQLAAHVVTSDGATITEDEQILALLTETGRRVLDCTSVRFIPFGEHGDATAESERSTSPLAEAMAHEQDGRRPRILTVRDTLRATPGAARSLAAIRLHVEGDGIDGYLEATSDRPHHFDESRLAHLELLAEVGRQLLQNSRHLQKLVFVDARTQIFNKAFFDIELEQFVARARRDGRHMALAIADIDRFKDFNTRYGYQAGDQVLHVVAQTLKHSLRPFDIVARWGGEEFGILLAPPVEHADALGVCERLRQHVEQTSVTISDLDGREHVVDVSISIGGALYPHDGQTADELWRHANEALLAAKGAGRNRVHFREQPHERRGAPTGD